jgi:hypothetical protein
MTWLLGAVEAGTASRRLALAALFFAVALVPACSKDPTTPAVHTISGRVQLRGYLLDSGGRFLGTRLVNDADGVRIDLAYGNRVVATTSTTGGIYRFPGLGPGAYVARVTVFGQLHDTTDVLTIASNDVVARDTLRLNSYGDLSPVPNPMAPGTRVYFEVTDTAQVEVRILDMAGTTVKTLFSRRIPPGFYSLPWDGLDETGATAPAGLYWVSYLEGESTRAHLLFK